MWIKTSVYALPFWPRAIWHSNWGFILHHHWHSGHMSGNMGIEEGGHWASMRCQFGAGRPTKCAIILAFLVFWHCLGAHTHEQRNSIFLANYCFFFLGFIRMYCTGLCGHCVVGRSIGWLAHFLDTAQIINQVQVWFKIGGRWSRPKKKEKEFISISFAIFVSNNNSNAYISKLV